jgi:hypothetical protein
MQETEIPVWLPFLFPFFFVGMWLFATTMIGVLSGWNALGDRFPDRDSDNLLRLRWQSGRMGRFMGGANFGGCLTLTATTAGLRIAIWRPLGPFQSPFLVPWERIRPEPAKELFTPAVRLHFGETGQLTVAARVWERLSQHARSGAAEAGPPPVSRGRSALAYLLQWAVIAVVLSVFAFLVPRIVWGSWPPLGPGVLLLVMLGVAQLIRFIREG